MNGQHILNYVSVLDIEQTERAIKLIKDTFENYLALELNLRRVSAPLVVIKNTGINDDLNGIERKVTFPIKDMNETEAEVVNSLAKWKRMKLADYSILSGCGLYTDMNAIRPDEELDNLHSLYVDQWDWEKHITNENRCVRFLRQTVEQIYSVFKATENILCANFNQLIPMLPENIEFFHSEELLQMYPDLTVKEREAKVSQKFGAVFIIGIGGMLSNNTIHDGRAPDYDDWSSRNEDGYYGLNGDIIFWNDVLEVPFEVSSMGIRVNKTSLVRQLEITNSLNRLNLYFHKRLLNDELPLSIGGGLGQSRICMYFLRKAHIGEVQSSIWSDDIIKRCKEQNISLL